MAESTKAPTCGKCGTPMEGGFLLDKSQPWGGHPIRWCPGTPQWSKWSSGVRSSQLATGRRILSYRCPACGYLESYAP